MKTRKKEGFTLVELLVVISIIGILTVLISSSFSNSQQRSRDAAIKSGLKSLSGALTMYYADLGLFPAADTINDLVTNGREFSNNGVIYMKKLPENISYKASGDLKSFKLYATLENEDDQNCVKNASGSNLLSLDQYTVGSGDCIYVVTSSNIGVTETLN